MAANDMMQALQALDLEKMKAQAYEDIRSGKVTRRQKGVKLLRAIDGLERSGSKPEDLMITKIPVIPPAFRPFAVAGETFIPGDANELYSDLIKAVTIHRQVQQTLGDEGAKDSERYIRGAVRAAYGYDDSPNPKIRSRRVSGLFRKIIGAGPKVSFVQSKLLSKPQDFVGRGVISPDPELGMDEVAIPESMAWEVFGPHIRRRLAAQGIPGSRAIQLIKDHAPPARKALEQEMAERPINMSRAPAWHNFNYISSYAKFSDGDNIKISPLVTAGLAGDFDGDAMSIHVPTLPKAVRDSKEKLLPSKMLFSIRSRDKVMPQPKHEMVLGLASAQLKPSDKVHRFNTRDEAMQALQRGDVKLQDRIEIPDEI